MRKFIITAFLLSFIGAGLVHSERIFAEEKYSLVTFYLTKGERFLEKEDYLSAMDQFLIVTLLDPSHKQAREYLSQPGMTAVLHGQYDQYKLKKFLDLADQTDFLDSRIAYLDDSNDRLFTFIEKNNLVRDQNRENFEALASMVKPRRDISAIAAKLEQIRDSHGVETLGLAIKMMLDQKDQSLEMLKTKQEINSQLRSLKQKLLDKEIARQKMEPVATTDQNVGRLREQLTEKQMQIENQNKQIQSLRGELKEVQLEFGDFQRKMSNTDQKLAELTKELAGMSLDVFGKQKIIDNKDAMIQQLSDQLKESQAQLQLVQGIIEEKDGRIAEFQEQLVRLEERVKSGESVYQAPAFGEIPVPDQAGPVLFPMGTDGPVAAFEEKLDALTVKYQTLEDAVKEKESQIAQLNQLVGLLDRKIISYRQSHAKKEQELVQVRGMLEIYKGRLEDTCEILKKRDLYILQIEQQLRGLESLFDQHTFDFSNDSEAEQDGSEDLTTPSEEREVAPPSLIDSKAAIPILESTKYRVENLMNTIPLNYDMIQFK